MKKILVVLLLYLSLFAPITLTGCNFFTTPNVESVSEIPKYSGRDYITINGNVPNLKKTEEEFETYSNLDYLGRCGVAYANISEAIMPTTKRESIGSVKPTGWQTVKYDSVEGKYLYNRCHLIGFQLAGENANEKNLITGTRYLNTKIMLQFENKVADYCKATGNHCLYRVTPVFTEKNLVADGVQIEALSVEDNRISFNVFCYNIQPGIEIDYATGNSHDIGE